METTKTPRSKNHSTLLSTSFSLLALRQIQLQTHFQERVCYPPERVTESVAHKREVGNVREGSGIQFTPYPEEKNLSMAHEVYQNKLVILTLTQV